MNAVEIMDEEQALMGIYFYAQVWNSRRWLKFTGKFPTEGNTDF